MNSNFAEVLRQIAGTTLHGVCDLSAFDKLKRDWGICLPQSHRQLLIDSNGVEGYYGYFRIFGIDGTESINSMSWNEYDCWKFAWGDRASNYWCFGETAWGDQYAYALDELRSGPGTEVYLLSAFSMTPEVTAPSFEAFILNEFIRSAKEPYDATVVRALQSIGPLGANDHLVYVPSILIAGSEDENSVEKMSARLAMTCNGDIAMQLDAGPPDKCVGGIESYEDDLHRMRFKIVWN